MSLDTCHILSLQIFTAETHNFFSCLNLSLSNKYWFCSLRAVEKQHHPRLYWFPISPSFQCATPSVRRQAGEKN